MLHRANSLFILRHIQNTHKNTHTVGRISNFGTLKLAVRTETARLYEVKFRLFGSNVILKFYKLLVFHSCAVEVSVVLGFGVTSLSDRREADPSPSSKCRV